MGKICFFKKPFSIKLKKISSFNLFLIFQLSLCERQLYVLFNRVVLVETTVDRTFMIVCFIFVVTYKSIDIFI